MSTNHTIPCMVCSPDKPAKVGAGIEINVFDRIVNADPATNAFFGGLLLVGVVIFVRAVRVYNRRQRATRADMADRLRAINAKASATNVLRSST